MAASAQSLFFTNLGADTAKRFRDVPFFSQDESIRGREEDEGMILSSPASKKRRLGSSSPTVVSLASSPSSLFSSSPNKKVWWKQSIRKQNVVIPEGKLWCFSCNKLYEPTTHERNADADAPRPSSSGNNSLLNYFSRRPNSPRRMHATPKFCCTVQEIQRRSCCFYCEKDTCQACLGTCQECSNYFCKICLSVDYVGKCDRVLCVDCLRRSHEDDGADMNFDNMDES